MEMLAYVIQSQKRRIIVKNPLFGTQKYLASTNVVIINDMNLDDRNYKYFAKM